MGACLENYQTVINLIESDAWQVYWNYPLTRRLLTTWFPWKRMRNIFLRYTPCAMKFVYTAVPSIVVEPIFLWYILRTVSAWLKIQQYQFSQVEEVTRKISTPGYCPFNNN